MCKSIISEKLENGINIELYMDIYGIKYIITAFTCDYMVIETKRTSDYFNALHKFSIMRNKYTREGKKDCNEQYYSRQNKRVFRPFNGL